MKADRRGALLGLGAGAAALAGGGAALAFREPPLPPGTLTGADLTRGHRLRQGKFPAPSREERVGVVIAGGGISGLSAGWTLAEAGFDDFALLELEDEAGGNARSGRNAVSAYPLGAHYLPIPNREATALRHMLGRMGIITGEADGLPVYDPMQLCADLQERLFWRGRWQEGLVPRSGLSAKDKADLETFDGEMARAKAAIGSDGRPAFATPTAYSSADPAWRALDRQSFAAWLRDRDLTSPVLLGHVRYSMRDDYGTEPEHVSAWAGIHYWAGRRGFAAADVADNVLTWPGGNGHLAGLMTGRLGDRVRPSRIVHAVTRTDNGVAIDSFDVRRNETVRTHARAAILAMPLFVTARLLAEVDARPCTYAPWIVANVTVAQPPRGAGVPLAWDNVSTTSESLGYVVATHQNASTASGATVLSWYLPLSDLAPASARRLMLERPADEWKRIVRDDLLAMHPELEIGEIALWRWGHAMIRPTPGYVWGAAPRHAVAPPLFLAHADLSGLSLFEEAHFHGVRAAEAAMTTLGHAHQMLT